MTCKQTSSEIFELDFQYEMKVEFWISANGIMAFDPSTEIEIYSINGLPEHFYSDQIIEKIIEDIRFHGFKDPELKREMQGEKLSDESRGN